MSKASDFGLPEDIIFRVSRGNQTSDAPCTFAEMLEFLDACGIDPVKDEVLVAGIVAGVPFEIDGATMHFRQIREVAL